jgi:hypothetical protein
MVTTEFGEGILLPDPASSAVLIALLHRRLSRIFIGLHVFLRGKRLHAPWDTSAHPCLVCVAVYVAASSSRPVE